MDVDEKDPDHLGSPDDEGWKELVIDLGDSLETMDKENKVNKIKNKVVSDLIKEEQGVWLCKACKYKNKMPNRIRDHIINRHFNVPLCPCKFCDTYCKNKSALKRHMNRQHKDKKRKKETGNEWFRIKEKALTATQNNDEGRAPSAPLCPPPPPPALAMSSSTPGQPVNVPDNNSAGDSSTKIGNTTYKTFSLTDIIKKKL